MTVLRFPPLLRTSLCRLGILVAGLALFGTSAHAQLSAPAPATAAAANIALLPFDGKESSNPPKKPMQVLGVPITIGEALSARPQSSRYHILAADVFGGIARIKYHGKAPDLRAMARLLKANVLIGGWLEATPGPDAPKPYRLTLTLYDVEGQLIGQLGYDLDSPTINTQRFLSQATAFFQMLDTALKITPASPPAVATLPAQQPWQTSSAYPTQQPVYQPQQPVYQPQQPVYQPQQPVYQAQTGRGRSGPVRQADDIEEAPLVQGDRPLIPKTAAASDLYDRRPPWQSAFEARIGYLYNTRMLTYDAGDPGFRRAGASGVDMNFEIHPLAFVKSIRSPLAGLGARLSAMVPVWGTVTVANQDGGKTGNFKAGEYRVEAALRWHWNFWDEVLRPDVEVEALFGDHALTYSDRNNLAYLPLPPTEYRYMGILAGARMHFTRWLQGRVAFSFAKHLSMGLMSTPGISMDMQGNTISLASTNGFSSFGPGSGWLWRADIGATAEIFRGIIGGFSFYYEQNRLSFDGQGNILQSDGAVVKGAHDEYMGVMLTVGYYFRPSLR